MMMEALPLIQGIMIMSYGLDTCLVLFLQTVPNNRLWLPITLLFLAGIVKYGERTRALYLASLDSFRKSMLGKPDPGPNYAKLMEEYKSKQDAGIPSRIIITPELIKEDKIDDPKGNKFTEILAVREGYTYFNKFKGLIVDLIFSISDRNQSHKLFQKLQSTEALRVIAVELNFIYEALYTKLQVVHTKAGYFFRFVSLSSVVAALVLFTFHEKHGFKKFDVGVTYALLYGAIALEFIAFFRIIFSDWTAASLGKTPKNSIIKGIVWVVFIKATNFLSILEYFLSFKEPRWVKCENKRYTEYEALATPFFSRRWSESIWGNNLIAYILQQCPVRRKSEDGNRIVQFFLAIYDRICWILGTGFYFVIDYIGAGDTLDEWRYKFKMPFLKELWRFIFLDMKRKSEDVDDIETVRWICSARGALFLRETKMDVDIRHNLMPYVEEVAYDESLIIWHIATDICYYIEKQLDIDDQKRNEQQHPLVIVRMIKNVFLIPTMIIGSKIMKFFKTLIGFLIVMGIMIKMILIRKSHHDEEDNIADQHEENDIATEHDKREFSKLLSDYMLYLLVMQPTMMSAVAGIGQIRFRDTCAEAENFFTRRDLGPRYGKRKATNFFRRGDLDPKAIKEACQKIYDVSTDVKPGYVKGDRSKSVLFDACRLAKELEKLGQDKKWNVISQVWLELLSYAASHCRTRTHAQQVSKGGELVTLVWLLMAHFGLGEQFQIKEGHARAKLIVDEPRQHKFQ
ncbi:Protein of unknown function (DUF594) [Quillaja saponaria]|uniref:DUF4220 domain-containing protein n=1 Tax=Quillaja saponaria TaxID=32244 RepID=A0AAD7Q294_QUISA|nr:Protein of unknown function (DUF594) [Quillaja saponaria]